MKIPRRAIVSIASAGLVLGVLTGAVRAHPMEAADAGFVQLVAGPAPGPFVYLGAEHMVTGYDHLLFLIGVIFFLYRARDVVLYVSLFTVGHSLTLLAGVIAGLRVDPYAIDAIIGLSVVYKGFENIGGFERLLKIRPNTRIAVLVFGLFHGLGLATRLQDFTLAQDGLLVNIVSFNIGVEVGQVLALGTVLIGLSYWRARPSYLRHAFLTNTALMAAGFLLAGHQLAGFVLNP